MARKSRWEIEMQTAIQSTIQKQSKNMTKTLRAGVENDVLNVENM